MSFLNVRQINNRMGQKALNGEKDVQMDEMKNIRTHSCDDRI